MAGISTLGRLQDRCESCVRAWAVSVTVDRMKTKQSGDKCDTYGGIETAPSQNFLGPVRHLNASYLKLVSSFNVTLIPTG